MMPAAAREQAPRRTRRFFALCLALFVALAVLAGCSEEPPAETADSVKGKTPVVRPEDVHGQQGGGANVLSPDYRQGLTSGLEADAERGAKPSGTASAGKVSGTSESAAGKKASPSAQAAAQATAKSEPAKPAGGGQQDAKAVSGSATSFPVAGCRQLVLVTAEDMRAGQGTMRRFARESSSASWREAGSLVTCSLGRKGLGVGRGLTPLLSGPVKRQGDGTTPAGIFPLTEAFGYASAEAAKAAGVRLPYVAVSDRVACVTDARSRLFGRVAGQEERAAAGVGRQDRMVRDDGANVWGVGIGHNIQDVDPEAGTCLFVNVRPPSGGATGGSIGCSKDVVAGLLAWLDPAAEPVLVVLPQKVFQERQAAWGLP
ncbi:MAG: hypothetical protein AB9872_04985 [Solidesulfovibrio sp.]